MTGTGPTIKRTVFSTSRASEFLELRALQAQTGQHSEAFGHVVVKELLDNALDAAESAGRAPVIEIATRTDDEVTFVTVTDNGGGIAPATVTNLCDFTMLVSDKARYRGPTRGAQGNAFKTLLGIPYALGVIAPVVIESAGVRHELRVIDRGGDVVVTHETTASDRTVGTSVTVPLPARLEVDAQRWAYGAALVNPHATLSAINQDQANSDENRILYKCPGQAWSKWKPSQPSSPHWYDRAAFSALVHSYIRTGVAKPLGSFIGEFDGLSGSAKQRTVRASVPGTTHLSDLQDRDDLTADLHQAMLQHAKPTVPKRLGPVGEDHLRTMLDSEYGVKRLWFKSATIADDGIPWIVEVAVADTVRPGQHLVRVQPCPVVRRPAGPHGVRHGRHLCHRRGVVPQGRRRNQRRGPQPRRRRPRHLRRAAVHGQGQGRSRRSASRRGLRGSGAGQGHQGAAEGGRAAAQERQQSGTSTRRGSTQATTEQWSVKEAVFEVLVEAKEAAGHIVAARTLYYKVRPLVQKYTDEELKYSYFAQTLLPDYQREYGPLEGLYYEARGELHHPHDTTVTPLGTREVEDYKLPPWQFDKILYIEKTGLKTQLAPYRLGQKYDMAVIYGKGYSPTACRNLLARPDIRDMKLFVLHDADINGYDIARTLGEATKRMPDHNIEVIDLGLTVPQAIEHGLETEEFVRKSRTARRAWNSMTTPTNGSPARRSLPDTATGGPGPLQATRCELNAFSSDGLAEFIADGLARHGVTAKIVPPPDVLAEHVRSVRDEALTEMVWAEIADMVDIDALVRRLIADHPDLADIDEARIRDTFTDDPTRSWRSSAQQLVNERIDATDWPRRRAPRTTRRTTGHAAGPRGVAPSPVASVFATSTTTVTSFVEARSASH